jgi:hypothetical protein
MFSKWIKRSSDVIVDEEDWRFLTKNICGHYIKKIENCCSQVHKYQSQLIKETMDELTFAVWRTQYDDMDESDADDDNDYSGSDDSSGDDDIIEEGPLAVPLSDAHEEPTQQHDGSRTTWEDMKPFLWRRVRTVRVVLSPQDRKYFVNCGCQMYEGTCIPCCHQLNVMETFQEKVNLRDLDWHPRVKNLQYYSAVISDTPTAAVVSAPHIRQVQVDEWRDAHPNSASMDGVPLQGRLDSNFDPVIECRSGIIDDDGPFEDGSTGHDVLRRRATRPFNNAIPYRTSHEDMVTVHKKDEVRRR